MQVGASEIAARAEEALASARVGELARAARGADAEEAGRRFEAMLGSMLAKELRSGLDEGFFGSGPGSETFESWLDELVGRVMAERGSLGVGELVATFARGEEEAR